LHALAQPELTEDGLIAAIADALGKPARPVIAGIGDDAAAWQPKHRHVALVTTDMLVDGVHFRRDETTPADLGWKALAENLSDIAAMGGAPSVAVIGLGIVPEIDETWIREFYRGMASLARSSRCAIVGGDITCAASLTLAVAVVGEVRRSSMRLRSGARAGDVAAITGPLGLAAAGLRTIEAREMRPAAVRSYVAPVPRLAEGKFLGARRAVHAMMDISDGLSTDIARMARSSGVGAVVDANALFVHPEVSAAAGGDARAAMDLVLNGGDDYELLVAVDRRAFAHVARTFAKRFGKPLAAIGKFVAGERLVWIDRGGRREPLPSGGYDHLKRRL
jgi:thiamine-monophosphate kinase